MSRSNNVWPQIQGAVLDVLLKKGCSEKDARAILSDMAPRCTGLPTFVSRAKPNAVARSPRPRDIKKFAHDHGRQLVADVNEFVDNLVAFFIERMVDLEFELHTEKTKER